MPLRCAIYHWDTHDTKGMETVIRTASAESGTDAHVCDDPSHMCKVLVRCVENVCPGYIVPPVQLLSTSGTWTAAVALPMGGAAVMVGRYV